MAEAGDASTRDAPLGPTGAVDSLAGPGSVPATAARVKTWLFDHAFPFWAETGVDRQGPGFVEHLTLGAVAADVPFKRVRVQARQIYCFCQADALGWPGDSLGPAGRGVELLIDKAWAGRDGGWASVLSRSGDVIDPTPDLYDIAFVLFALGWWFRVTGDARVPALAGQTLDFLHARMRHPSGEGYLHRLGGATPHLQNPHMHLTEAMLVLRDTTRQDRFAAEADALVELCLGRFLDVESGALAETFSESWAPQPGPSGLLLEPGHHYEWIWLLDQYLDSSQAAASSEARAAMQALFRFAVAHGQDETGLVVDSILADGTITGSDHRLWPQAERLKAWAAMNARFGTEASATLCKGMHLLFTHYLDTVPTGTWIEYRDRTLRPKADKIPASSFYHLVLAFSDMLRFDERLRRGAT